MQITFCGAARNVTGSSHLITLKSGYKILLDCGLFQGDRANDIQSNREWHFDPSEVDCLILSHAHIDHTGRVPQLVKDGFSGCIHSTHATRSLCAIMLLDSAKIQEKDSEYYNKKMLKKAKRRRKKNKKKKNKAQDAQRIQFIQPLYSPEDVAAAMNLFNSYSYNRWHRINEYVEVLFKDQGHILGSASVTLRLRDGEKTITLGFTGDIGRPNRPILRDPQLMPEVDYLICESTYGHKEHETAPQQSNHFLQIIHETCVQNRGKLIIPAFSIGRTQELVYMLDQLHKEGKLPTIPVFVDSPLAVNATEIYGAHPECFDNELNEYMLTDDDPFGFNSLHYVRTVEKSKELNEAKEPMVIISASGMMNAGRIRHHLFNNLEDPRNTFLIVGYCTPDTAGGILKAGATQLKVFGKMLDVKAKINSMDSFSAHGDRREMLETLRHQKDPCREIFLVHGEYENQQDFKEYLHQDGFRNIEIPYEGQVINI